MELISAAAVGTALAADACAVSVVCGASSGRASGKALITAASFGFFQAVMPVLGWSIGRLGGRVIGGFDSAAALIVLCIIGGKMIFDAFRPVSEVCGAVGLKELLLLSVATRVDAMAAGVALPAAVSADTAYGLAAACGIIGIITFVLSFFGFIAGKKAGNKFPAAAQFLGGAALILLGIKAVILP